MRTDKRIIFFFVKFILLYCLLYGFNYAFTGITSPPNYYNPWLDQHLNYLSAFRVFLLSASSSLIDLFGYKSVIYKNSLHIVGGVGGIRLAFVCMGTAVICFWWAFVIAFPQTLINKIKYFILGTLIIVILNILRITFLTIYLANGSHRLGRNHHAIFNLIAYSVMSILIFFWINQSTAPAKRKTNNVA